MMGFEIEEEEGNGERVKGQDLEGGRGFFFFEEDEEGRGERC